MGARALDHCARESNPPPTGVPEVTDWEALNSRVEKDTEGERIASQLSFSQF
ncbi:hypothetical protein GCM10017600_74640 [Streptosporangium carneum]|uniref:Uncharacterized protein n=1 Tax=Streptosporangium carneum TaxID=47481 RepID=A0A9W6MHC8_9ACTN|nr:hypothetical protein GCM10017600_74640 [Streptosporangium carneum]